MGELVGCLLALNDANLDRRLVREPEMQAWLNLPKPDMRIKYEITDEMRAAIDRFYFNHYCRIFQSGAFARATASMYVFFNDLSSLRHSNTV